MSDITLQPVGLVDSSNHYWSQRIDTTTMAKFQSPRYDVPTNFSEYVMAYDGTQYFPPGTDYQNLPLPEAATTLLGDYKIVTDQRLRIKQEVYTLYGNLKDYFHNYANTAHLRYNSVLTYLGQLSAQIAADSTPSAEDLKSLHAIVEERSNFSSKMEQTASDLVTALMEISSSLNLRIKSITQCINDLDRETILTRDEARSLDDEDRDPAVTVRWVISAMGYTHLATQVIVDAQAVCDEMGVTITEMQAEQGRWKNITSDLTNIEKYITSEQTTAVQIIASLDNEQIIERWKELGDIGTSNSNCIMNSS